MKQVPANAFARIEPGGFRWEKADCAVRAVSAAFGIMYNHAHACLKAGGRQNCQGVTAPVMSKAIGRVQIRTANMTYADWLVHYKNGTYIVFVTGHLFAVVDGVQHDLHESLYKPRAKMICFWKILGN